MKELSEGDRRSAEIQPTFPMKKKAKTPRAMIKLMKLFGITRSVEDSPNALANRRAQQQKAKAKRRKATKVSRASRKVNRGE